MKTALHKSTILHKSAIPPSRIFVIKHLRESHFDPSWHAHSEYQLFVVLRGGGTRFIGDSIKAFKPGELIFTCPHLPHLWRSDQEYFSGKKELQTEGIVIYFNENFLGDHFLEKEEIDMIRRLFNKALRGLEFYGKDRIRIIDSMKELLEMKGVKSVMQLLAILTLMAETREFHYISSRVYNESYNTAETIKLNKVYDYVLRNFSQSIVLTDLAELLNMTPTSFSRYFTMKNNKTFSRFVSEIRIKEACKLLTETDESIARICYACGFNTPSNFHKQFRDVMAKTPNQYKREFMSI